MKAKTRRALLYIFMSLFILTMFTASLTLGRYSAELESDGNYQGDYEYILTDTLVVNTVDEFFDAIENGYSNIQIGDDVDNPLIIAGDINDVRTDLTIDLNGHEIQRNNRDPLLNVEDGITLTIIDSKGGGSLYNPVGSVLRVGDEGTITVAAGIFESGPRSSNARNGENAYNEYYSSTDNSTGAGAKIAQSLSVQYYDRTVNEQDGYSYQLTDENVKATLPIIIPNVKSTQTETEWCHTVNGNMFFSSAIGGYNSTIMKGDTYLYFTVEGDSVQNTAIAASNNSANYYYQYYVQLNDENPDSASYTYAGRPVYVNKQLTNRYIDVDGEEQTISDSENSNIYLATVYVYNDVKETVGANNPYAAIEATGGNIYVRGGTYYSYFGKENTYCINANGGYMSVDSSSAISFYAYGNGVCVNCDFTGSTRTGDADLRITNGNFYSELGNTISVTNGVMEIGTATFTKDAGTTSASGHTANGSAISVEGGGLKITSSATFNITGSGIDGIHAEATSFDADASALVDVASVTMTFNSDTSSAHSDNRGIYSKNGAISCKGTTNVTLNGGSGSTDNFGIYTLSGQITVNGDTTVSVSGEDSNGVYSTVEKGTTAGAGRISITGDTFTCTVKMNNAANLSSTAISTAGGNINFNVGSADIDSDGLGITALNMLIDSETGNPDASTAIQGAGNITFESSTVTGATNTIDLDTPRGTGMYIYGGGVTIEEGITFYVTSDITAGGTTSTGYGWQSSKKSPTSYDGIYIQSGSLDSQGTLNVTHTGVQNDNLGEGDNDKFNYSIFVDSSGEQHWVMRGDYDDVDGEGKKQKTDGVDYSTAYSSFVIKSYAVRVEGENKINVNIRAGNITNYVGGGIYISSNNNDSQINLGDENLSPGAATSLTVTAEGDSHYVYETRTVSGLWNLSASYEQNIHLVSVSNGSSNWGYLVPRTGGHAVQIVGGRVNIYNGKYSAEQGNGILVEGGDVTITDGEFIGNDNYIDSDNNKVTIPGAGASYGFKTYGGKAEINGGNFGGSGGGAFAMGASSSQEATVNMYSGTISVTGSTGFSVWTNATVTFGRSGENGPTISAEATGLAIETTPSGNGSTITINSGTFMSTNVNENNKNGIWRGGTESILTINGGTFVGSYGNGLNSAEANCKIDGGEFYGRGFNSHWEGSTWVGAYSAAPISYMNNPGNYNNNIYVINGEEYNFNYLHIQ